MRLFLLVFVCSLLSFISGNSFAAGSGDSALTPLHSYKRPFNARRVTRLLVALRMVPGGI
jgi:hypothetical protein